MLAAFARDAPAKGVRLLPLHLLLLAGYTSLQDCQWLDVSGI
jgi:hypothetical protein